MEAFRISAVIGVTTYNVIVRARSADEAFDEALEELRPRIIDSMVCQPLDLAGRQVTCSPQVAPPCR